MNDPTDAIVLIGIYLGILALAGMFIWTQNELYIKNAILSLAYHSRYIQLPFLELPFVPAYYRDIMHNLPNLYTEMYDTNYKTEYTPLFLKMGLRSVAIVMAAIFLPLGIYIWANKEKISFTRRLTVEDIININRKVYPRVMPATAHNLLKKDPRFWHWASQLNPIELAFQRGLLSFTSPDNFDDPELKWSVNEHLEDAKEANLIDPVAVREKLGPMSHIHYAGLDFPTACAQRACQELIDAYDGLNFYSHTLEMDIERAREYYTATLGPLCHYSGPFIDISKLPPNERALWILFLACIAQEESLRNRIDALLDQFSRTFVEDVNGYNHKIELNGVDELYEEIKEVAKVKIMQRRISKRHAYYYTAFTALYTEALDSFGTITARDFHWLFVTNRLLWLSLNQVGMEVARPEVAGIKAHYLAEKVADNGHGMRIRQPVIESAVLNLYAYLQKEEWVMRQLVDFDTNPDSPTFLRPFWVSDSMNKDTDDDE